MFLWLLLSCLVVVSGASLKDAQKYDNRKNRFVVGNGEAGLMSTSDLNLHTNLREEFQSVAGQAILTRQDQGDQKNIDSTHLIRSMCRLLMRDPNNYNDIVMGLEEEEVVHLKSAGSGFATQLTMGVSSVEKLQKKVTAAGEASKASSTVNQQEKSYSRDTDKSLQHVSSRRMQRPVINKSFKKDGGAVTLLHSRTEILAKLQRKQWDGNAADFMQPKHLWMQQRSKPLSMGIGEGRTPYSSPRMTPKVSALMKGLERAPAPVPNDDCGETDDGTGWVCPVGCSELASEGDFLCFFTICPKNAQDTSVCDCETYLTDFTEENTSRCSWCSICNDPESIVFALECSNLLTGECTGQDCDGQCISGGQPSAPPQPTPPTQPTAPTNLPENCLASDDGTKIFCGVGCYDYDGDTSPDNICIISICPINEPDSPSCTCSATVTDGTEERFEICDSCSICSADSFAYDCDSIVTHECSIIDCDGYCIAQPTTPPPTPQPTTPLPTPQPTTPRPTPQPTPQPTTPQPTPQPTTPRPTPQPIAQQPEPQPTTPQPSNSPPSSTTNGPPSEVLPATFSHATSWDKPAIGMMLLTGITVVVAVLL